MSWAPVPHLWAPQQGHVLDKDLRLLVSGVPMLQQNSRKGIWSVHEHRLFLQGLQKYGKGDWRNIAREVVKSRTSQQVASHAQKYFARLKFSKTNISKRPSILDITAVDDGDPLPQYPAGRLITELPSAGVGAPLQVTGPGPSTRLPFPADAGLPSQTVKMKTQWGDGNGTMNSQFWIETGLELEHGIPSATVGCQSHDPGHVTFMPADMKDLKWLFDQVVEEPVEVTISGL